METASVAVADTAAEEEEDDGVEVIVTNDEGALCVVLVKVANVPEVLGE